MIIDRFIVHSREDTYFMGAIKIRTRFRYICIIINNKIKQLSR